MITCPNCAHTNPEGATQCEACYTPLPAMTTCPNCQATVSTAAEFCGQCGYALHTVKAAEEAIPPTIVGTPASAQPRPDPGFQAPETVLPPPSAAPAATPPVPVEPPPVAPPSPAFPEPAPAPASASGSPATTQLQQTTAQLLHVQSNSTLELPPHLDVVHIGKPNERIPPDIDVSGFPDADIVSRIHADIRVEADAYYLEDVGSSNGTYVNNLPLRPGNRHRLRPGDRIALGKGDKVSFLFQIA